MNLERKHLKELLKKVRNLTANTRKVAGKLSNDYCIKSRSCRKLGWKKMAPSLHSRHRKQIVNLQRRHIFLQLLARCVCRAETRTEKTDNCLLSNWLDTRKYPEVMDESSSHFQFRFGAAFKCWIQEWYTAEQYTWMKKFRGYAYQRMSYASHNKRKARFKRVAAPRLWKKLRRHRAL